MATGCPFCQSNRLVRLSQHALGVITGSTALTGRTGHLGPELLNRFLNGGRGMLQQAMAEPALLDGEVRVIWFCRACGFWEAEADMAAEQLLPPHPW